MSRAARIEGPATSVTVLGGRSVNVRVRKSSRATAWRLVVHPDNHVVVTVPARMRLDVPALLASQASWVLRHLDRFDRHPVPACLPLTDGAVVSYRGRILRLNVSGARDGRTRLDADGATLRVAAPDGDGVHRAVEGWYREQAPHVFAERVHALNAPLGLRYGRITVRDQRTRWGSCSPAANLSFNWRLLMAPAAILDSVVFHELAHVVDRSHAASFWRRLAAMDPSCQTHRRWLHRYGPWLRLGCDPPPLEDDPRSVVPHDIPDPEPVPAPSG